MTYVLYTDDYEDDDIGDGPGRTKIKLALIVIVAIVAVVAAHAHFTQVPGRLLQAAVYPRRLLDSGRPR